VIGTRSIRRQLLISLALTALLVLGAGLPLVDRLIVHQFGAFEIDDGDGEAKRLELLLNERADRMRSHAVDYSDWSTTVGFVEGTEPSYIEDNLYTAVLKNFDADFVFIADRERKVRFFSGTPAYVGQPERPDLYPLPEGRLRPVLDDARVLRLLDKPDGTALILQIEKRWYFIGAGSISHPDGPPDREVFGVLGFVSELSPARIGQLRRLAGLPFSLSANIEAPEYSRLEGGDVMMRRILNDQHGQAMAALEMRYRQPLSDEIRVFRLVFLLTTFAIFLLGAMLIWLLVDRGVISRLERLHAELGAIAGGGRDNLSTSPRSDEVDALAQSFNHVYAELQRINDDWRHEALHDSLTGLGNRANLVAQLHAAPQGGGTDARLCLLLIDLDGFKTVNDLFGHAVGDQVLRNVADRMRSAMPPGAHCFRLGGDEFAVLAPGLDVPGAKALAHTLNATARAEDSIGPAQLLLSASIGIACRRAEDEQIASSELMQRADIALYAIKRKSRNGFAVFDESMLEKLQHDNRMLRHLRQALLDNRIDVWFQPIVSAHDGSVLSFEALARWSDGTLGEIPPLRFVAIAEENFLGAALDRQVLQKAVAGLQELRKVAPELTLSVNASVQSLLDPGYVTMIPQTLARAGLEGAALRIEITESVLAANEEALMKQLDILRESGVRFDLDDFGTGYSSLGRLVQIQPRGIKLDRSFVLNRREDNGRVCRAIAGLAHELGIEIVAEGIETEEDAAFLREAGCGALQGYLYARPQPLMPILDWLRMRQLRTRR